jgi:hypothetical protein
MRPARIFISYAHEDEAFRKELGAHLSVLRDTGIIEPWHDRLIRPGALWAREIDDQLERADVAVLLVSAYFFDSGYSQGVEVARALERSAEGQLTVVPVICRACLWENSRIAAFQVLPPEGKPIEEWDHAHRAWAEVARGINEVAVERGSSSSVDKTVAVLARSSPFLAGLKADLDRSSRAAPEPSDGLAAGLAGTSPEFAEAIVQYRRAQADLKLLEQAVAELPARLASASMKEAVGMAFVPAWAAQQRLRVALAAVAAWNAQSRSGVFLRVVQAKLGGLPPSKEAAVEAAGAAAEALTAELQKASRTLDALSDTANRALEDAGRG